MRLVLVLALLWLASNLVLFGGRGWARIDLEAQISQRKTLPLRRALAWQASPYVLGFERAVIEARRLQLPPGPLVVVFPEHTSIFTSIAWHELFPSPAIALRNLKHLERVAQEAGARLALILDATETWKVVDLAR